MANAFVSAKLCLTTQMKILLVEDNAEMRRFLKRMVEEITDRVIEAGDGSEAVGLYRSERPDWVLMDIFMKPGDGFSAAREIKSVDSEARIIFVSSHTDKRTRQEAHEAGGAAFFGKDDLLSLVEFLRRKL